MCWEPGSDRACLNIDHVNPEAVDKLDRTGATTIAGFISSERVRKELEKASGGYGRRMLVAIQSKARDLHLQSGVPGLLGKYGEYLVKLSADGSTFEGSAKGQPAQWRKGERLGACDTAAVHEHDH